MVVGETELRGILIEILIKKLLLSPMKLPQVSTPSKRGQHQKVVVSRFDERDEIRVVAIPLRIRPPTTPSAVVLSILFQVSENSLLTNSLRVRESDSLVFDVRLIVRS